MDKEYWLSRWQENKIGFNQSTANSFLQKYLPTFNLSNNAQIFVPLCGKSIDMFLLGELGYQVIGVELSINAARQFFEENDIAYVEKLKTPFTILSSKNITIYVGDFFLLEQSSIDFTKIEFVYDRAALIALPKEMRQTYVKKIKTLFEKIDILLLSFEYDQAEMPGPPFSVNFSEIQQLYQDKFLIESLTRVDILEIPERFSKNGLKKAIESIYKLTLK